MSPAHPWSESGFYWEGWVGGSFIWVDGWAGASCIQSYEMLFRTIYR